MSKESHQANSSHISNILSSVLPAWSDEHELHKVDVIVKIHRKTVEICHTKFFSDR